MPRLCQHGNKSLAPKEFIRKDARCRFHQTVSMLGLPRAFLEVCVRQARSFALLLGFRIGPRKSAYVSSPVAVSRSFLSSSQLQSSNSCSLIATSPRGQSTPISDRPLGLRFFSTINRNVQRSAYTSKCIRSAVAT